MGHCMVVSEVCFFCRRQMIHPLRGPQGLWEGGEGERKTGVVTDRHHSAESLLCTICYLISLLKLWFMCISLQSVMSVQTIKV
ncbi:hypothetical protein F7725_025894 [Dissostichus mawsoni]|uniref:Uncharacterized protein n=1 Tax=Dissostichus mawsoni TaxID=36200 RepID=A0A7J5X6F3_DISMA|nr:hypothetical protein F7725_025894 [Dissostichus mawsoni]